MPPRDVPDVRHIITTKRRPTAPRPADEEYSFAPRARSTSRVQDSVASSRSTADTDPDVPMSPAPSGAIDAVAETLPEATQPAGLPTQVRGDHGSENSNLIITRGDNGHLQFAVGPIEPEAMSVISQSPSNSSIPALMMPTLSQRNSPSLVDSELEGGTIDSESVTLIDESIWPTQSIIDRILELRASQSGDSDYIPSGSESDEGEHRIHVNPMLLPAQPRRALLPNLPSAPPPNLARIQRVLQDVIVERATNAQPAHMPLRPTLYLAVQTDLGPKQFVLPTLPLRSDPPTVLQFLNAARHFYPNIFLDIAPLEVLPETVTVATGEFPYPLQASGTPPLEARPIVIGPYSTAGPYRLTPVARSPVALEVLAGRAQNVLDSPLFLLYIYREASRSALPISAGPYFCHVDGGTAFTVCTAEAPGRVTGMFLITSYAHISDFYSQHEVSAQSVRPRPSMRRNTEQLAAPPPLPTQAIRPVRHISSQPSQNQATALAGTSTIEPPNPANVQAVLHARLSSLLARVSEIRRAPYGSAYTAIRLSMVMEDACTICGFRIGHAKETPLVIEGVSITQAHLIRYFSLGAGKTFWNLRSVCSLARKARDYIVAIDTLSRNGKQALALEITHLMLQPDLLIQPYASGAASHAATESRPAFEGRCAEAMGKVNKR
ncbi:hypothetical protein HWV62_17428 [Athelia sp. TMB]|nr:hypothetical protein HWV62_17428 [Athelia sp. TMB]